MTRLGLFQKGVKGGPWEQPGTAPGGVHHTHHSWTFTDLRVGMNGNARDVFIRTSCAIHIPSPWKSPRQCRTQRAARLHLLLR